MSSLKHRVEELERQKRALDARGFTWEEFLHIYRSLAPRDFKRAAEEPGGWHLRSILDASPPRNIDSLVERWERRLGVQGTSKKKPKRSR